MSFDIWEMLLPKADKYGQKVGAALPGFVSGLVERVNKKFNLDWHLSVPPEAKKWLPEVAEAIAGGLKVDRGTIPFQGKVGDEVHEYVNEFINALGLGASEQMQTGAAKTDGKAKAGDKPAAVPADPKARKGFVTEGIWYPVDCTHAKRPWGGKGQKTPDDITLEEALARGHSYCQRCIRDLVAEADKPAAKADQKPEDPKPAEPECKLPRADHTVFDLLEKLRDKDAILLAKVREVLLAETEKRPELKAKIIQAFHGRGTLEQFERLVIYTKSADWERELDFLLGKSKAPEGTLEREKRETNEAIAAFTKWIRSGSPARKEKNAARTKRLEELRAIRRGEVKSSLSGSVGLIVLASLAVIVMAAYFITQT